MDWIRAKTQDGKFREYQCSVRHVGHGVYDITVFVDSRPDLWQGATAQVKGFLAVDVPAVTGSRGVIRFRQAMQLAGGVDPWYGGVHQPVDLFAMQLPRGVGLDQFGNIVVNGVCWWVPPDRDRFIQELAAISTEALLGLHAFLKGGTTQIEQPYDVQLLFALAGKEIERRQAKP